MNIRDIQNENIINTGNYAGVSKTLKTASESGVNKVFLDKDKTAFNLEDLKTFDDLKAKAMTKDVSLENNVFAVMACSMSADDVAKMSQDGFSPEDMSVEETVTNLDRIKATLVKSGVSIPGFTDDLSDEEIEKIAGSANAGAVEAALKENMLPATKANVEGITEVIKLSESVSSPSAEAVKYMINNDLEPTVNNFYIANHSSVESVTAGKALFYRDSTGYVGMNPTEVDTDDLMPQIEKIITDSGLEVTDRTLNDAKWLIEKDIPLTKENLEKLSNIESVSFPLDLDIVARTSAASLADGKKATEGVLTESESIVRKAAKFVASLEKDDISARRMLEETRLALTVEAGVFLLKKGIKLDTSDLQKLVDDLKRAEKDAYAPFLMEDSIDGIGQEDIKKYDDELTLKLDLFRQTSAVVEEIKTAPLETAVDFISTDDANLLADLGDLAAKHKAKYDKAELSYETMMTSPRYDMGDNIKKAFRNVDDILIDLNLEASRLNEKAVRALGYAGIEINENNIADVGKAITAVENVITHMTPARTLKMIRDGENPLDMDLYELSDKLVHEDEELDNAKYTEFLYKLEKSVGITEAEKSAFIGIYRLFRTIEKSDGKLVGDVIKADDRLTLSNIISASRSDRHIGTDVKIDDSFGALEKLVTYGESITDQILKGFSTKQLSDDYAKTRAEDIREMLTAEETVIKALENANEPESPVNMAAAQILINNRGSFVKGLKGYLDKDAEASFDKGIEELKESFDDEDSVKEAYSKFKENTEELIKKQTENADKYIDVRSLKLINKQLSIISSMADSRTYEVPVMINGELTSINLKIVSDAENAGKVKAYFETEETGKISAEFSLSDGMVSGTIVTENSYFEGVIRERENNFKSEFEGAGVKVSSMYYMSSRGVSVKGNYTDLSGKNTPATKQLYSVAKAIIKAVERR